MNLDSLLFSITGLGYENFSRFTPTGIENGEYDKKKKAATKIYSDLINNELSAGMQPEHEKHDDYKILGLINFGDLYPQSWLDEEKERQSKQ